MSTPETPQGAQKAQKADPAAMALRTPPRSVVRLNRRMLAILAGVLAAMVLGATLWSLQPARRAKDIAAELYNVDRVSRAEALDQLPRDYSKIPPQVKPAVPALGVPLPGDLGPAIVKSQQPMEMRAPGGGVDPAQAERLAAEEAARSSVFFRSSGNSGGARPASIAAATVNPTAQPTGNQPFDPMGSAGAPAPVSAPSTDPTTAQNRQEQKQAFMAQGGDAATRNAGSLQLPA
jgi:type IV secretory pathway VirB10-like protein